MLTVPSPDSVFGSTVREPSHKNEGVTTDSGEYRRGVRRISDFHPVKRAIVLTKCYQRFKWWGPEVGR